MSGGRQRRKRRPCERCDKLTLTRTYTTDLPGEVVSLCDPCWEQWVVEEFRAAQARDAFMGEPDPAEDDDDA